MNAMSERTMNVMSERTMTNSARPNLDASLAEAYENAPYPRNPRLRQGRYGREYVESETRVEVLSTDDCIRVRLGVTKR